MALYGLRNFSSDHTVIRNLLKVLELKVIGCTSYTFGSQEFGNVFYGLRNMSNE